MGLFGFVKEAGKKLGFGDDEPEAGPAVPTGSGGLKP